MHESLDEHMLEKILSDNDSLAEHNREHFDEIACFVLNMMSAPGAGKTTLLEASLERLAKKHSVSVIEGDMVGELDALRLRALNTEVFQICTGRSCHLDARMIARLLHAEKIRSEMLLIENVGNLVCPAEFQLGEHRRAVILSVAEGDDKPIKYPVIFRNCDLVIFSKCDLLPFLNFDIERAEKAVRDLNSRAEIFKVSARTGEGIDLWLAWLEKEFSSYKAEIKEKEDVSVGAG